MKSVFSISNYPATSQVKFATCTLQDDALTWWNSHVKTTTPEVAHAMPWAALKKMMTDKYCPRGEIKKIETEMWNLKVKGTDVVAYNRRFQQLALMCSRMFPEEVDKIEKQKGKESMMIFPRTIQTNNSRIGGRTQARPMLQAMVTGSHTKGLSLYVPSVIAIMKQVLIHLGAVTAIGLAIWPGTVGYGLLTTTTTTTTVTTTTTTTTVTTTIISRAMVALSAELKATLKETARN
ncbi:reverse transcriptase domain-containing protein [Tanacetum coccineum]